MNPFGPVFTPGKGFSAAEGFSAAQNYSASKSHSTSTSSTFRTPVKGSAMKFLNLGSTPEEPSTKASSASPVKPIGSGFSSPSRQASFRDGPPFSTDADPNVAETRFVRFGMIPLEWFKDDTLKEVLHGVGSLSFVSHSFTNLLIDWSGWSYRQLCCCSRRHPSPPQSVRSLR
jgi:hypothetical protein